MARPLQPTSSMRQHRRVALTRETVAAVLLAVIVAVCALPAAADIVEVYAVGSNPPGLALDPFDNDIGGAPTILWNHVGVAGPATLSILAEGIDGPGPGPGELDEVLFNGVAIGFLTQQGFFSPEFNLNPGPGALAGITGLTTSVFDVIAVTGLNTVEIHVPEGRWTNEIEVSTLSAVPEPATVVLLGAGLGAFVAREVRRVLRGRPGRRSCCVPTWSRR